MPMEKPKSLAPLHEPERCGGEVTGMHWLLTNWFSLAVFAAFIAMHMFGHGGHGGHGGHAAVDRRGNQNDPLDSPPLPAVRMGPAGHQHQDS